MTHIDRRLQKLESRAKPEAGITVLFAPKTGASDAEAAEHQQELERAQAIGDRVIVVGFVGVPPPGVEAMTSAEAYLAMLQAPTSRP